MSAPHPASNTLLLALASACALAACEPLADSGYRGEPLLSFQGKVASFSEPSNDTAPFRVGLFWVPELRTNLTPADLREQASIAATMSFPQAFQVDVFELPPAELLTPEGYGVAFVLVYQDKDRDGRYDAGELAGGSRSRVVLHAPVNIAATVSPTQAFVPAGSYLTRLPITCPGDETFDLTHSEACGVPLGQACSSNADCGNGVCVKGDADTPFPGGACGVLDTDSDDDCVPHGGASFRVGGQYYWLAFCTTDSECRTGDGYSCDPLTNACLADSPVSIALEPGWEVPPLCLSEYFDSSPFDDFEPR